MLSGSCDCGAVTFTVPGPPAYRNACQCGLCRRYGAVWGYYRPDEVRFGGAPEALERYTRGPDPMIAFVRCRGCGCVTHWADLDPEATRLGVNTTMMPEAELEGIDVRHAPGPP